LHMTLSIRLHHSRLKRGAKGRRRVCSFALARGYAFPVWGVSTTGFARRFIHCTAASPNCERRNTARVFAIGDLGFPERSEQEAFWGKFANAMQKHDSVNFAAKSRGRAIANLE
jgi:hypothetical protein